MDSKQKASLISKRVSALAFSERVFVDAEKIVTRLGLKLPGAAKELWKEWLNDLVATTNTAVFRAAARDPGGNFLEWLKVRATRRFHVTWRALEKLSRTFGPEIATRFISIVWLQELAWAQRMRLFDNPHVATKAALFLRETEGNPSKTFSALAEIYADVATRLSDFDNPAQELAPESIRFDDDLPDFTPLFLQYASKAYKDVLSRMDRSMIQKLADRARSDELSERDLETAREMAATTRLFPMRQVTSVITAAISFGIGPNELFLIENAFIDRIERGETRIERGVRTPQTIFLTAIADRKNRKMLVSASISPEIDPTADIWEIARIDRRWLDCLPSGYRVFPGLRDLLEQWKLEIVEGRRNIPYDRISDFGFFITGAAGRI